MKVFRTNGSRLLAAAAVLAAAAIAAPAASAAITPVTTTNCDPVTPSQVFAQFGDTRNYFAMPGGTFEAGDDAWTLTGGASIDNENEPWNVNADSDSRSLYLPEGASAISPTVCIGQDSPTARWFNKVSSRFGFGNLKVTVLVHDASGTTYELPVGTALYAPNWKPSAPGIITASFLVPAGQKTPAQFRFRAVDGDWNVDDAYVDPFARW